MKFAVLQDHLNESWLVFRSPKSILTTRVQGEVQTILERVEEATTEGITAVGFVSYEASAAFDPALKTSSAEPTLPLIYFALYEHWDQCSALTELAEFSDSSWEGRSTSDSPELTWKADVTQEAYLQSIAEVKTSLARGDTYQANYSFRLRRNGNLNTRKTFQRLMHAHLPLYGAYFETDEFSIFSASPELFFSLDKNTLTCKPMKGTIARGKTQAQDLLQRDYLRQSKKDRAENVMIVDMIRNDMSKVAQRGTVEPSALFAAEKYPHLWQLTSTVQCQTDASLTDIFTALFPCASITGAPKASTMQILNRIEHSPREIYTGAIGCMRPGRHACFNVAIRTGWIDHTTTKAEFGIGSGVVWDSCNASEYDECLLKGAVLDKHPIDFQLLETIRWDNQKGFFLLDEHLKRLQDSADYFSFRSPSNHEMRKTLDQLIADEQSSLLKIRLLLSEKGQITTEVHPFPKQQALGPVKLQLAMNPISKNETMLYHKTTDRRAYSQAQEGVSANHEVILWNKEGEITETSIANIVVRTQGRLITPSVSCGLLPGTFRDFLLRGNIIQEGVITIDELQEADAIYLVNSLRGWRKGELATASDRKSFSPGIAV